MVGLAEGKLFADGIFILMILGFIEAGPAKSQKNKLIGGNAQASQNPEGKTYASRRSFASRVTKHGWRCSTHFQTHRLHGAGILTYMWDIYGVNVAKYYSTMEHMEDDIS